LHDEYLLLSSSHQKVAVFSTYDKIRLKLMKAAELFIVNVLKYLEK